MRIKWTALIMEHGVYHSGVKLTSLLRLGRIWQLRGNDIIHILGGARSVLGPDNQQNVAVW
ncbi:MAG: hypothetical protein AAFP03_19475 [Cyanobacteria bacterium J06598_3]